MLPASGAPKVTHPQSPKEGTEMAKLPKKVEEWKAPWDDEDIDPAKAKAFAFSLARRAEEAAERAEAAETALRDEKEAHGKTTSELEELRDKDTPEVERLRKQVEKLQNQTSAAPKGKTPLEVAMEVGADHDLTLAQVLRVSKRITGDTEAALRKDASDFIEEFELGKGKNKGDSTGADDDDTDDDDDSDIDDDTPLTRRPVVAKAKPGNRRESESGDTSMTSIRAQMPPRR
jgi:polyhydroxyalkanoate synthesis regulator phasin